MAVVKRVPVHLRERMGAKKEFLREILDEVRINGTAVRLTYKLPLSDLTAADRAKKREFFTLYDLVEQMGVEPTASALRTRRSPS
jgi:hypothetical protein